jgi:glucose/mannose-6-phosphate isomerase
MTFEEIYRVDTSNMYKLLREFPHQAEEAVSIGKSLSLKLNGRGIRQVVLTGLGGSAIGGDLLRSYAAGELKIPFIVNRHYTLPGFVGRDTLVIASSYSGNTEETIAAHREAVKRRARVLCITSGGETERIARRKRQALIKIPPGYPPRAALGYAFFPLLHALVKLGLLKNNQRDIRDTITVLHECAEEYGTPDPSTNLALQLAEQLRNRIGIIYSSVERFDAIATRWRTQIGENGKALMFGHVIPEMNHNELVGWKVLREQMRELQVVILRDKEDHPRVQLRIEFTKQVLSEYTPHITEVWSKGNSPLSRMFSLVALGDWVSYYLAILHGEDPTPVKVIDELKATLSMKKERAKSKK